MERKLLFFDIDGTLAMPGTPVSEAVVESIRTARAYGHLAFISTGRPQWLVSPDVMKIGFDGGLFHAGGRVVIGEERILDQCMAPELVDFALDFLRRQKGVYFLLECADTCYRNDPEELFRSADERNLEGAGTELRRLMTDLMNPSHKNEQDYQGESVYKVSFFAADREKMKDIVENLSAKGKTVWFENLTEGYAFFSGEMSTYGVDKGTALEAICRHVGAERSQCIAFGDSMNDAEIILAASEGIAMGNAENRLKALADRCCESVAEDGVAKELERLGLC